MIFRFIWGGWFRGRGQMRGDRRWVEPGCMLWKTQRINTKRKLQNKISTVLISLIWAATTDCEERAGPPIHGQECGGSSGYEIFKKMKENKARKEEKPREAVCLSGIFYCNTTPETCDSQGEMAHFSFRGFHPWSLSPTTMSLWQDKESWQKITAYNRTKLLISGKQEEMGWGVEQQ